MNDFKASLAKKCKNEGIYITLGALTLLDEVTQGSQFIEEILLKELN